MAEDESDAPRDAAAPHVGPAARPGGHGRRLVTIATALIEADGRILHWSADAQALLGYPPDEAVGRYAAQFLVEKAERAEALAVFERIVAGEDWSGTLTMRHRDGHRIMLDFRTYQVTLPERPPLVLVTAYDVRAASRVEADVAMLDGYFTQSPIGMALYDEDLRYVRINATLAKVNGLTPEDHIGRTTPEVLIGMDGVGIEDVMRRVLETGEPVVDSRMQGSAPGDPGQEHAWSVSYSRLEDPAGRVLGVSSSVIDITERFRAEEQAARARERLAHLAEASAGIGTTLDVRQTARELAQAMVPTVADLCGVLILEGRLGDTDAGAWMRPDDDGLLMRRLAVSTADPDFPHEELPVGVLIRMLPESPYAEAMRTGRTVVVTGAGLAPLPDNPPEGRLRGYFDSKTRPVRIVPLVARERCSASWSTRGARTARRWTSRTSRSGTSSRPARPWRSTTRCSTCASTRPW